MRVNRIALAALSTIAIALAPELHAESAQPGHASTALLVGVAPGKIFAEIPACGSADAAGKICSYPREGDTARIELPPGRPSFLAQNPLLMIDADGKVETVVIVTKGLPAHEAAWEQLTLLFGPKPAVFKTAMAQNAFGATFRTVHAEWRTPTGVVLYDSAKDRLSEGEIMILPPLRPQKR